MSQPHEICGLIGEAPLYRMDITLAQWHRLVELCREESVTGLPDWIDYGNAKMFGCRAIATTDPDYFKRTKEEHDAQKNSRRDRSGFPQP